MRLLLDTSAVLAAVFNAVPLSSRSVAAITDPGNEVFVSPVSVYEIEVKARIGKLTVPSLGDWRRELVAHHYGVLPATLQHYVTAARLPPHHRDLWDRILIAQALEESLIVVTADRIFPSYGVVTLW